MPWRRLLLLPDGARVESRFAPSADELDSAVEVPRFRFTPAQGSPVLFDSLAQISAFLAGRYDVEVIERRLGFRVPEQRHGPDHPGKGRA